MGSSNSSELPASFKHLFWDCSFKEVKEDPADTFVIKRILTEGTWAEIQWLRCQLGDSEIKGWLLENQGRGLTPRQLRFWQLLLDLPGEQVSAWIEREKETPWHRRRTA